MLAGLSAPPPQALKPSTSSPAHMGRKALRKAQRQPGDKARGWR
ncbi:hypothetical protein P245_20405 [Comamonas thiooxydans]|uniref:Uncharacterized protein n=1 Tax=Comamonas thiooxydans TaxID=363952 RepID=A0A0E3BG95_9BURK|nr:hypothetical protein P245_20405 [Comamonas thiooxydans]